MAAAASSTKQTAAEKKALERQAARREAAEEAKGRQVTVKLAHPFAARFAVRVGLGENDFEVGDDVDVSVDDARAMIDAGLVQVDPFDKAAVAKVLEVPEEEVVVVGGEPVDPQGPQNDTEPPAGGGSVQS